MSRLPPAVPSTRSQTLSGAPGRMAGCSDTASSLMELVLTLPARGQHRRDSKRHFLCSPSLEASTVCGLPTQWRGETGSECPRVGWLCAGASGARGAPRVAPGHTGQSEHLPRALRECTVWGDSPAQRCKASVFNSTKNAWFLEQKCNQWVSSNIDPKW